MQKSENNYAFIDSQNLNLGIQSLGWRLDFRKFRIYLREKYHISKAYLFLGYIHEQRHMYRVLHEYDFSLIFKPVIKDQHGMMKGNVDAELVLQAMIDYEFYERAVIVTSDGDFYCLVQYLYEHAKLYTVLSPSVDTCSALLKRAARDKIWFIENMRDKLALK